MILLISETWFNILLLLMAVAMIVLGYFVQKWLGLNKPQATMSKSAWANKVYGRKAIQTLRKLNNYASGLGKDEVQKLKTDLSKGIVMTMSHEEREQVRETADGVIDSGGHLEQHEFTYLVFKMGSVLLQSEEENTEEDVERFRQLCVMYDDLQKRITKLKIKCPGCGRSLKGVTQAMIGDVGVCPKCKAEFIIEPKDKAKNNK